MCSAACWILLYECITMHCPQNVITICVLGTVFAVCTGVTIERNTDVKTSQGKKKRKGTATTPAPEYHTVSVMFRIFRISVAFWYYSSSSYLLHHKDCRV
jgi:hypothetical protein